VHPRYVDLAARIVRWAEREPGVHGLIVIGSQAREAPPADEWSDLDLMVFCEDPGRYLGDTGWLRPFGHPLCAFTERTPLGGRDWEWLVRRVLYADGRDVDFSLLREDRASEALAVNAEILAAGWEVRYDPAGTLPAQVAGAIAAAGAATDGEAQDGEEPGGEDPLAEDPLAEDLAVMLYHVIWAMKKIRRGEIWVAAGCLNSFLREPLWRLIAAYNRAGGAPQPALSYGGRYLERTTAPEVLAMLRGCAMPYEAAGGIAALRALLNLLAALGPRACVARGLAWDSEAYAGVRAMFEELAAG